MLAGSCEMRHNSYPDSDGDVAIDKDGRVSGDWLTAVDTSSAGVNAEHVAWI